MACVCSAGRQARAFHHCQWKEQCPPEQVRSALCSAGAGKEGCNWQGGGSNGSGDGHTGPRREAVSVTISYPPFQAWSNASPGWPIAQAGTFVYLPWDDFLLVRFPCNWSGGGHIGPRMEAGLKAISYPPIWIITDLYRMGHLSTCAMETSACYTPLLDIVWTALLHHLRGVWVWLDCPSAMHSPTSDIRTGFFPPDIAPPSAVLLSVGRFLHWSNCCCTAVCGDTWMYLDDGIGLLDPQEILGGQKKWLIYGRIWLGSNIKNSEKKQAKGTKGTTELLGKKHVRRSMTPRMDGEVSCLWPAAVGMRSPLAKSWVMDLP